jgi:hypothetical protein
MFKSLRMSGDSRYNNNIHTEKLKSLIITESMMSLPTVFCFGILLSPLFSFSMLSIASSQNISEDGLPYLTERGVNRDAFMRNLISEWRPMDQYEAMNYLTSFEVCSVFTSRRPGWCNTYFSSQLDSKCLIDSPDGGPFSSPCPNVVGTIYRHRAFPDPSTKRERTIVDFIILSLKHGIRTLYLIGDSVSHQHFFDLHCDLLRYGLEAQWVDDKHIIIGNLDSFMKNHSVTFNHSVLRPAEIKPLSFPTFRIEIFAFGGYDGFNTIFPSIEKTFNEQPPSSFVALFNVGLHFNHHSNQPELLKQVYSRAFRVALDNWITKNRQFFMFRETSAQHWPTVDGGYGGVQIPDPPSVNPADDPVKQQFLTPRRESFSYADLSGRYPPSLFHTSCKPILTKEQYDMQNWRNDLARKMLNEIDPGNKEIPIIPFFDLTVARHDFHVKTSDCTHFCHGPMLWVPVISEMYSQLEEALVRRQLNSIAHIRRGRVLNSKI